MLDRLGSLRGASEGGDGGCLASETPGVKRGVADEIGDLTVILAAAGFHGEVFSAGAHVFGRRSAGEHLKLIDSFNAHGEADDAVVALLINGGGRHAVEIELTEV